jgi:competence protein ComEC
VLSHLICLGILLLAITQLHQIIGSDLNVSVLDVGQGDAILIQTPEYKNVLIDAGEGGLINDELGKRMGFFDKTIDLFILTHPHFDHFGGLLDVIQKYRIKQILMTGVNSDDQVYADLLKKIKEQNIPILFAQNDKDIQIGKNTYLDIIYPFAGINLIGQKVNSLNNTSIVIRLIQNNESLIMLPGDAEMGLEREILLSGQYLNSKILKLGHHGSRTATSDGFLSAVDPDTAVISAGKDNKFGHPHSETLEKITNLNVRQTMIDGSVEFNF